MVNKKHTPKKLVKKIKKGAKNIATLLSLLIILLSLPTLFCVYYLDRVYPNIYIAGINLGGKTKEEAINLVSQKVIIPKSITLSYKDQKFNLSPKDLEISFDSKKTLEKATNTGRSGNVLTDVKEILKAIKDKTNYPIDFTVNQNYLDTFINNLAETINVKPIDAKFNIINGKVQTFQESSDGLELDKENLKLQIINTIFLNKLDDISIEIPTTLLPANVKTSDVNTLGIKELIGSGTSHFAGSSWERIYNINLAALRINGTLIAPNSVFSFDQTVGDISKLNGYKEAYVIQNGQTILGDGGGVCQVSTTMFRAAINTGLLITERHAHAYRVHYYEEDSDPGFDATIYTPTVDLKFKNDTDNYILIQTQIDLKNLVLTFNLYGTQDGRKIEITKPKLWGYQPAPQPQYIDDPTLPLGQVKQVDFAASGIKSQFDYTVTKNGETINHQTFFSDFKPWQAKYLRGTKQT